MISKILSFEQAQGILQKEHQQGRKIVFTNGCFDILHVGHVRYLNQARQLGDRLLVALNTDVSVQRLKGPSRPLVCQNDRAEIMASLACVDYVVLFDEDTPLKLIQTLKPDVLVKGGDYRPENIVGYREVIASGGRVDVLPFSEGRSTTQLVEKILIEERRKHG